MLYSKIALLLLPLAVTAQRVVRFISDDGKEYTGDAILQENSTDARFSKSARVIEVCLSYMFVIRLVIRLLSYTGRPLL